MLKSRDAAIDNCPISFIINEGRKPKWIAEGVQQIGGFGSSASYPQYEHYPDFEEYFGPYGVCDNYQQIIEKCPEISESQDREFMITLTEIKKSDEPAQGGWRWHKWGEYIGEHEPEHEYLFDEDGIESVFCYHVYELKAN